MKSKVVLWLCALLLTPASRAFCAPDLPGVSSDPEQFQVKEKTEVPNTTLEPGTYSIRIVDHLSDRVILQVSGKSNHVQSTFLAVPASTMANAPIGPIAYGAGPKGKAAMKGFAFPGGTAVEFVYPKNDAVSIAQANGTRVMAIDPASEGKVPAPKLKHDDMQMITLWMLEPARVGAADAKPTISASRYQAPATAPAPAPVQTAQAQPEPAVPAAAPAPAPAVAAPAPRPATPVYTAAQRPAPSRQQLAQNDTPAPPPAPVRHHVRPANVTALPHTASQMPLLWMGTLGALLLGGGLSARRLSNQA